MLVPTFGDIAKLVFLPCLALVSWLLPERFWLPAMRCIANGLFLAFPDRAHLALRKDRRFKAHEKTLRRSNAEREALTYLKVMQGFRDCRPFSTPWSPVIHLQGLEHIETALTNGNGVILWIAPFTFDALVAKIALHRAGHPVHHLSRPEHGVSRTAFGERVLNPIWQATENKYLASRILITDDAPAPAVKALRNHLRRNAVVSITLGSRASKLVTTPFLEQRTLKIPTAPMNLALAAGAPILPVYPIRRSTGEFEVTIDAPLTLDATLNRTAAFRAAARDYARRLERSYLCYTEQAAALDAMMDHDRPLVVQPGITAKAPA